MLLLRTHNLLRVLCALIWLAASTLAVASEYRGQVSFNGLPHIDTNPDPTLVTYA